MREVLIGDDKLEIFPEFRCLIDMHSTWGGCKQAAVTCCRCVCGKFANSSFSTSPSAALDSWTGVLNMCWP